MVASDTTSQSQVLRIEDPLVRAAAARQIFDRAYGKPAADVTLRHNVDPNSAHLEALAALVTRRTIESETPPDNE